MLVSWRIVEIMAGDQPATIGVGADFRPAGDSRSNEQVLPSELALAHQECNALRAELRQRDQIVRDLLARLRELEAPAARQRDATRDDLRRRLAAAEARAAQLEQQIATTGAGAGEGATARPGGDGPVPGSPEGGSER